MKHYLDHLNEALPLLVFFTNNPLMKPYYGDTISKLGSIRCFAVGEKHTTAAEGKLFSSFAICVPF